MTLRPATGAYVVALAVLFLFLGPRAAGAHAVLEATTPAAEAVVAEAPRFVELRFDESVDARIGGVQVLRPDGTRADTGRVEVADGGSVVRVPVDAGAEGTYTVAWRAVSADNHPLTGTFVFSVRARSDAARAAASADAGSLRPLLGGAARWLAFAGAFAAVGALAVRRIINDLLPEPGDRRLRLLTIAAAATTTVSVAVTLLVTVADASGRDLAGAATVLPGAVGSTHLGRGATTHAGLAALTGVLALVGWKRRHGQALLGASALGALLSPSLAGHAATADPAAVAVTVDALHLTAGALLVGGLLALAAVAPLLVAPGRLLQRFSAVALPAAAVILATGASSAWIQAGSWPALTSTTWGRLIGVKVAGFTGLVVLGALNRRALANGAAHTGRVLASVRVELMVAALVLAATTLVTNRAPARSEYTRPVAARLDTPTGVVSLTVGPARVGTNEMHLYFLDRAGRQRPVDTVEATVTTGDAVPRKVLLTPVTAAHFSDYDLSLPTPGRWTITITSIRDGRSETTTATLPVR
ncbi:MAG: copper resistance protein CopC [Acidimicrobiales bacterium]